MRVSAAPASGYCVACPLPRHGLAIARIHEHWPFGHEHIGERQPVGADDLAEFVELNLRLTQQAASKAEFDWRGARVLDVACGSRQIAVSHLWHVSRKPIGVDIDLQALQRNGEVTPLCADMYALPLRSETLDIVVSIDTIEHSEDPHRFLNEIRRVLRPGGKVLILTPNLLGYPALIARLLGKRGADLVWRVLKGRSLPFDLYYRANTVHRLKRLARESGLRFQKVLYVPLVPHFFHRFELLSRAAAAYNRLTSLLRAPWLLPNMLVVLSLHDGPPGSPATAVDNSDEERHRAL